MPQIDPKKKRSKLLDNLQQESWQLELIISGFAIDGPINMWSARNHSVNNDSLLIAHHAIHRLYLNDSLLADVPWQFYEHPFREQQGLLYDLPVYNLPRGRHTLRFEEYALSYSDSLYWKTKVEILFVR